jgi:hypothetical protein
MRKRLPTPVKQLIANNSSLWLIDDYTHLGTSFKFHFRIHKNFSSLHLNHKGGTAIGVERLKRGI